MKKIPKPLPVAASIGALLILYSCFILKGEESWGISPALFCLVLGVALVILSFLSKPEGVTKAPIESYKKIGVFIGVAVLYALFFGRVNFVLLTTVFLFLISYITGKKSVTDNLIYSVIVSFSVYFIFNIAFGIGL